MATVDPCTLPLVPVLNDTCVTYPLGKQIVQVLYQEMAGAPPDLLTIAAGADVRLATLQAALTATTNAGVDKLFVLKNIAGAVIGKPAETKLQNNDVPYGGERLTDSVRSVVGRIDFLVPSNNTAMNNLTARQRPLRVWLVDEYDMVQGPISNASLLFSGITRAGINGAPTHREFTITYRGVREPDFAAAPLAGIASVQNAA